MHLLDVVVVTFLHSDKPRNFNANEETKRRKTLAMKVLQRKPVVYKQIWITGLINKYSVVKIIFS